MDIYRKLVDSHPNSREAIEVLSYLVYYHEASGDTSGLSRYLREIKEKYPNTEVSEEAEKQLRTIKE